jgi:DNA-binding transcriptional ArsR family regulator
MSAMDEVFKALADASRRSLLDRLHARNGQTLNELCDGLAMTRQAVTKHLAILEQANLVTTFRHGREKLHYLNPVPIHQIGERWIIMLEYARMSLQAQEGISASSITSAVLCADRRDASVEAGRLIVRQNIIIAVEVVAGSVTDVSA